MKHMPQTQFGRADEAPQRQITSPTSSNQMIDKWELLNLLTRASSVYKVSHQSLNVLRALLTFLPNRVISPAQHGAIVFPSNKTLSTRLNGMPESTIRRHIAKLIASGIISRHDSANRKRFARRVPSLGQIAFGFDLSPLAREMHDLIDHAARLDLKAKEHAALRVKLAHLRQTLIELSGPSKLTDEAFKILRRKPNLDILITACDEISTQIEIQNTAKMSASDTQNERHIQIESITISEASTENLDQCLNEVVEQCTEYKCYFPEPVRNWHDLVNIADRLTPMLGIERPVFDQAIKVMGLKHATTLVLCILEKAGDIHNPGGFFRSLTKKVKANMFSWVGVAPNHLLLNDCQLTI